MQKGWGKVSEAKQDFPQMQSMLSDCAGAVAKMTVGTIEIFAAKHGLSNRDAQEVYGFALILNGCAAVCKLSPATCSQGMEVFDAVIKTMKAEFLRLESESRP